MNDNEIKNNEVSFAVSNKSEHLSETALKPLMCGVGYHDGDNIDYYSKSYKRWHDMIHRCYNERFHERQPQYKECTVCEEWKNYSNFKVWYDENYYSICGEQMDLDKDILFKGNKIYSPNTCAFVPHSINTLFLNGKKRRGSLPLGVYLDTERKKYRVQINCFGKSVRLGRFKDPVSAFEKYKDYKEKHIKDVAEKYKDKLPYKVYRAMMEWKIEITD